MKTFFVNISDISNNKVLLSGEEHNHLKNVLRLNKGAQVCVVCGDEYNYNCEVVEVNKNNSLLKVNSKTLNTANPKVNLTAFVALIKNDKLNLIIQKLTELGVTNIIPFESKYTIIKDNKLKHEKLQVISNQSIKQCGRSIPAKIYPTINISQIDCKNYDLVLFANESEKNVKISDVILNKNLNNMALIIGPEGGFTTEEKAMLIKNGAKSVTLCSRILRAETAAIMLTSLVLNYMGEFN